MEQIWFIVEGMYCNAQIPKYLSIAETINYPISLSKFCGNWLACASTEIDA